LIISTTDCFIWNSIASVCAPAITIHTVVKYAKKGISAVKVFKKVAIISAYGPTVVGLGSIPLIIHPIDHLADFVLDNSFRKIFP
jgi:mitochondrial fission process protein 1